MKKLVLLFPLAFLLSCSQGENADSDTNKNSDTIYVDERDNTGSPDGSTRLQMVWSHQAL